MLDAGALLQMIRFEHNISRTELAERLGITYGALKRAEDENGYVPEEWLEYLYDNYELSPE